jgi:hypothetical protein
MKVYYFGVWSPQHKGHHLHGPLGEFVSNERTIPWSERESLCPDWHLVNRYGVGVPLEHAQPQGAGSLHHKGGWTALAFWDRSCDQRGNCASVFFAEGTYQPEQMLALCQLKFPHIWRRFGFTVRVTQRPNDVQHNQVTCSVCRGTSVATLLDGWASPPPGWFLSSGGLFACSVECVSLRGILGGKSIDTKQLGATTALAVSGDHEP